MSTYSFKDGSGGFAHPLAGDFNFAGQIGMNQITFRMTQEKTQADVAADGATMMSHIAGALGQVEIEVQQTSDAHKFFLNWYNLIDIAGEAGDVSNWANGSLTWRSLVDGTTRICTGLAPNKIPDVPYAQRGQNIVWMFICGNIRTMNA